MPKQGADRLAVGQVPEVNCLVLAGRSQRLAVRVKGQRLTGQPWARNRRKGSCRGKSQIRIVPSSWPVASRLPSGEKQSAVDQQVAGRSPSNSPVASFHICNSSLADAARPARGLMAHNWAGVVECLELQFLLVLVSQYAERPALQRTRACLARQGEREQVPIRPERLGAEQDTADTACALAQGGRDGSGVTPRDSQRYVDRQRFRREMPKYRSHR